MQNQGQCVKSGLYRRSRQRVSVSTLDFRQCWVEEVLIVARRNKVVVQMIQNSNSTNWRCRSSLAARIHSDSHTASTESQCWYGQSRKNRRKSFGHSVRPHYFNEFRVNIDCGRVRSHCLKCIAAQAGSTARAAAVFESLLLQRWWRATAATSDGMPPTRRGQQRWDAALHVAGEPVFMNTGGATLPQASFQQLLGWVAAPSEGGNLTDLGMQAIKDGWWVDPPPAVLRQVRDRQARAFEDLQSWRDEQNLIEKQQEDVARALMPPPPPRPRPVGPPHPSTAHAALFVICTVISLHCDLHCDLSAL